MTMGMSSFCVIILFSLQEQRKMDQKITLPLEFVGTFQYLIGYEEELIFSKEWI